MRVIHRIALLAVVALAACDKPTGSGEKKPEFTNPPETAARELTLGQTVTAEKLDERGDVDEFAFTAPPGGLVSIIFAATGGEKQELTLSAFDSTAPGGFRAMGANGWETDPASMRLEVTPGRWIVRVRAGTSLGPYTLAVHATNRHPEAVDSVLPLRQWVHESIEQAWDVDEFVFNTVPGRQYSIYMNLIGTTGMLDVSTRAGSAGDSAISRRSEGYYGAHTGRFRAPPSGRLRIRVAAPDPVAAWMGGPYRLMLFPIDPAPEGVSPVLQHGQPVSETIDMDDDEDVYTFPAAAGDMFQIFWAVSTYSQIDFALRDLATGEVIHRIVPDGPTGPLRQHGWPRVTAPRDGTYQLIVGAGSNGTTKPRSGSYSLELLKMDPRPESVPAHFAIGQTVSGESIDPSEDVDVFTFDGTAGAELAFQAASPLASWVDLLPPTGDEPLVRLLSLADGATPEANTSRRITLPVTGTYRVRVWHDRSVHTGMSATPTGPYSFRLIPINYAPEWVPATISAGVPVLDERLEHRADIDVFTFTGQQGEHLTLRGEKLNPAVEGTLAMVVWKQGERVQPPLAYIWPNSFFVNGGFTVPETGTYEVWVFSASSTNPYENGSTYHGAYRVGITRP